MIAYRKFLLPLVAISENRSGLLALRAFSSGLKNGAAQPEYSAKLQQGEIRLNRNPYEDPKIDTRQEGEEDFVPEIFR